MKALDGLEHRGSCRMFYAEQVCTCGANREKTLDDELRAYHDLPVRMLECLACGQTALVEESKPPSITCQSCGTKLSWKREKVRTRVSTY